MTKEKVSKKKCVFCGLNPVDKNKEHVLPQWLLRLTGDPNRVVSFGIDYASKKQIKFSYSSFVAPSCAICNEQFSYLENETIPIIKSLLSYEALPISDYLILLDWLDKVRIGIWVVFAYLKKHPSSFLPHFHIKDRLGIKDRLLIIYPIESDQKCLSMHGVETFIFNRMPSCFGLTINNIMIINMSADYLFSKRCGFPYPKVRNFHLNEEQRGMLELTNFDMVKRIQHPIIRQRIIKPSVYLLQPVMQVPFEDLSDLHEIPGNKAYLTNNTIGSNINNSGIIYRQCLDRVEPITNLDERIDFQFIEGKECRTLSQLIAQVYDYQIYIQNMNKPTSENSIDIKNFKKQIKIESSINKMLANYLRSSAPAIHIH